MLSARTLTGWLIAAVLLVMGDDGRAQPGSWKPTKPVEFIVGVPPGSPNDLVARLIQRLVQEQKLIAVPIPVINKPGGGLALSWTYLNQHPGDGHYIAMSALNLLSNSITGTSPLSYADFTPIAQLFSEYIVISTRADSAVKGGQDLIERLRADPASLTLAASPGPGGANHVALVTVMKSAGIDFRKVRIVFFNAAIESATAVLGGHVDISATTPSPVLPHMRSGRLRILGVTAPRRLPGELAVVSTWKEQGADVIVDTFRGVIGPKGMGEAQVAFWEDVFRRLARSDVWRREVENRSWAPNYMGAADSRRYLEAQHASQKAILTELGLAK